MLHGEQHAVASKLSPPLRLDAEIRGRAAALGVTCGLAVSTPAKIVGLGGACRLAAALTPSG